MSIKSNIFDTQEYLGIWNTSKALAVSSDGNPILYDTRNFKVQSNKD